MGRTIYHPSKHKYSKLHEEDPEFIVPGKYYWEGKDASSDGSVPDLKEILDGSDETIRIPDQIIVDWDGPDDPEIHILDLYIRKPFCVQKHIFNFVG